ncbi:hypothetical protein LIPSTDRAFT_76533 [Lipomyces starkeyi NRRL Y-11557]|uniref:Xylanolytic transcriptional activator regulatory domain-containing protein n=1 Tax=Lipomyces starkeyi NRRL Y-11557 TaxID=675824 RepID=A0A1E3PW39_LIPST|nr:hypothetical protein LIPSTDRAFT_76533 [Lipomyces starkeyi NRRL Y-11557]
MPNDTPPQITKRSRQACTACRQEPAALPSLSNSHADSQTTPFHVVDNGVDGLQEHLFCQENNTDNLTDAQISFGTTNIDQGQITLLLNHFEQYYYRHCPIIQTNTSATTLYRSSPFLFWTIIVISSRFHPTLAQLYNALVTPYRLLLGKTLAEPIANLECIQGLVLLCLWPLAVDRQSEDSSWNYCGLVTNAAVRMGLHRETTESRAASSLKLGSEAMAHAKTWMACLKPHLALGIVSSLGYRGYDKEFTATNHSP